MHTCNQIDRLSLLLSSPVFDEFKNGTPFGYSSPEMMLKDRLQLRTIREARTLLDRYPPLSENEREKAKVVHEVYNRLINSDDRWQMEQQLQQALGLATLNEARLLMEKFHPIPRGKVVPMNLMVIGECGDGKSSLISELTIGEDKPEAGRRPQGVTKDMKSFRTMIGGQHVNLIDTPGVGDSDIKPTEICVQIDNFFSKFPVHGVLLCSSISKNRITQGAR